MEKILHKIKKIIPVKIFKAMQPAYHYLLSWFSAVLYGNPSENLIVIGVTGTTGKTTCVYLIAKALEEAGYKVGYTSTAMFNDGEKEWLNDKKMTMVGRLFTQNMLRKMLDNGCKFAIVETTSEGIVQHRHRFINFDTLVFTGLYPEHIESHGSFENYKQAKGKLFEHLKKCRTKYADEERTVQNVSSSIGKIDYARIKKTIIVNGDDEHAGYFLDFWAEQKLIYASGSIHGIAEKENMKIFHFGDISVSREGTVFKISIPDETCPGGPNATFPIRLKLLGAFNASNAMTAVCTGAGHEVPLAKIISGIENVEGIPGRLESLIEGQDFTVIVDYAFEPKALQKLYDSLKVIARNKIIHVIGSAGGGRDSSRRPVLGEIAGRNADLVIVTNEDPYDDDPELIIDQVASGAKKAGKKLGENLLKISDRREAIKKAINSARTDDLVIITGKGSEQAICVSGGEKITWDDRAVARGILNNLDKT